jgi:hypothetical protein
VQSQKAALPSHRVVVVAIAAVAAATRRTVTKENHHHPRRMLVVAVGVAMVGGDIKIRAIKINRGSSMKDFCVKLV